MFARHHYLGLALLLIFGTGAVFAASIMVFAQEPSHVEHARHAHGSEGTVSMMPGQEAFGTIQEIVRILEADPDTDWSKVNIGALREHLIDMDEVTMRARAIERWLADGVEITITGQNRTLVAIKRMIPAHARELAALGWSGMTEDRSDGVVLVVTSRDPRQAVKIKALGFMGIMVQGAHHQEHHFIMARGELAH